MFVCSAAPAQQPLPTPTPAPAEAVSEGHAPPGEAPPDDAHDPGYVIPDIPKKLDKFTRFASKALSLKLGFVLIGDYTDFEQDQPSIDQVGRQDDEWDLRAARMILRGAINFKNPWQYFFAFEYKGFDTEPPDSWGITDLWVKIPVGAALGKLTVGKQKEPFVYEMVGDAANLPQLERILSPFFVSRQIGLRLDNTALDDRLGWSLGWFNDWWATGDPYQGSGNDFATRLYGLPVCSEEGYVHVAVAGRYQGGDNDTLRYRGRPESNVASYYVDTGNIPADHAWGLDLEAQWVWRGFTVMGEYVRSWVRSPETAYPSFSGWYLLGSWVLTGEHRPYDKKVGYARRIIPTHRWGAPELVVRFSKLDLDDEAISGGVLDKWFFGANWWATHHFKLGAGYGLAYLDRFGTRGRTDIWTFRLQAVY
jgi:phosphate-selective porin